jgi:ADP-ribosyl-[dinitrogen reductase] hydrolase
MRPGRLPAGTFTDDTEMALAVADSLLACSVLDGKDLAQRFVAWYRAEPADVGNHTRAVLSRMATGEAWGCAVGEVQRTAPASAGNGSLMRSWPVALVHWRDLDRLIADSRLQSQVTHSHPECVAAVSLVNAIIYSLLRGTAPAEAVLMALQCVDVPASLRALVQEAPKRPRESLQNSGWVRHTLESAIWGLMTTDSFEAALVQVVNLGNDADTAGAVVGALAGATYGLASIPERWRDALHGEWPLRSGRQWNAERLADLADRLVASAALADPRPAG